MDNTAIKNKTEINSLKAELDFCEKGHSFTDIVPVSAAEHFGKDWYETIKKRGMDPVVVFNHSKKSDKLKPDDIILAGVRSEQKPAAAIKAQYELEIMVVHGNPDYNGIHKILAVKDNDDMILNTIFKETSDGTYKNHTKIEMLNSKLNELNSAEIKEPAASSAPEKKDFATQVLESLRDKPKKDIAKTLKKVALITGGIAVTATVIYFIVKAMKKKNPPEKPNNIVNPNPNLKL